MRLVSKSFVTLALGAMVLLSGCSGSAGDQGSAQGGGDTQESSGDQFCGPLLDDMGTAATVFSVAVPGQTNKAQIENRLALIEKIEAPADLADELDVWTGYLEAVVDTIDADDPSEAFAAYRDDPAVEPAGAALFDKYVDECMK